jgi:hypothetical protein
VAEQAIEQRDSALDLAHHRQRFDDEGRVA